MQRLGTAWVLVNSLLLMTLEAGADSARPCAFCSECTSGTILFLVADGAQQSAPILAAFVGGGGYGSALLHFGKSL